MDTSPTNRPTPHFQPKSTHEELALLLSDNASFQKTSEYLGDLLDDVLDRLAMTADQKREAYAALMMDIPVAAHRYLRNRRDITGAYPFSTYFTWYISERLNNNAHTGGNE